jgi:hypothetical protein
MTALRIKFVRQLRVWHRRLGVVCAVVLLWLAATGLLLNHADDLDLTHRTLDARVLQWLYRLPPLSITSFDLAPHFISQVDREQVYFDTAPIGTCRGVLVGAERLPPGMIAVICGEEIMLLDERGELLERIHAAHGLPAPINAAAVSDGKLLLDAAGSVRVADLDQLAFTSSPITPGWRRPGAVPPAVEAALARNATGDELNGERVLHDLHSGRLLGAWGKWLLDGFAIAIMVLAITGFWLWWRHVRR